jgi:hypothetical protein
MRIDECDAGESSRKIAIPRIRSSNLEEWRLGVFRTPEQRGAFAEALRHKRAQGLRAGNVPSGHSLAEDGQTLLASQEEQEVLAAIRDLRQGWRSLRAIASELNARGLRTRSGAAWRHEYVANLLRSAPAVM